MIDCNQGENGRALAAWGVVRWVTAQLPMFVRLLISTGVRSKYTRHLQTKSFKYNQVLNALYFYQIRSFASDICRVFTIAYV